MKGFRDTSRTMVGHKAAPMYKATGGTINRLAKGGHFGHMNRVAGIESQAEGKVEGLTGHGPSNNGNSAVMRSPVQPTEELKDHGGKTPLTAGYAAGGKPKVFHAHNHYHNGKKMPGKAKLRKMEMMAEKKATGGTINPLKKGGKAMKKAAGGIIDSTQEIAPDYKKGGRSKKATGGTINKVATGGTIDKLSAGGALYKKGGAC